MKVCVFGAGAVGGHIAARLAQADHAVSVVARGPQVAAIAAQGLTLKTGSEQVLARVRACASAAEAGAQDLVFVTVKATAIPSIGEELAPLCGLDTPVVFVVNGIPWWYGHAELDFLDPGGRLARSLGLQRVIGSVVFSSNEVVAPGVIQNHSAGLNTLTLGELDGSRTERVSAIAALLEKAHFSAPVASDIRKAVWTKLVRVNLAQLPICTLVGKPMSVLGANPELLSLAKAVMREGIALTAAHGFDLGIDVDAAFDQRMINLPHKPSMLQDFERGRVLEIDAVLKAPQRFARSAGVPTPHLDALVAILVQRAVDAGLYGG